MELTSIFTEMFDFYKEVIEDNEKNFEVSDASYVS